MARNNPRSIFGIHSFTPYNIATREPYGQLDVLGGSTLSFEGEVIDLMGGSSQWPYKQADGGITAEMTLTIREYADFLFEVFYGKKPTATTGETTGNITTAVNAKGTSVISATTGIDAVTAIASSESDLKMGKYLIKAVTATTVDIYALTDVDFGRGTAKVYEDDTLKITPSPLTITTGADTNVTGFGFKLEGGSGTIGMTIGDTATFDVRPVNSRASKVIIGGSSDTYPEFGALLTAQKLGSGETFMIDLYRCKAIGFPINFTEKEFSESEITAKISYDRERNGVFEMTAIDE